MNERYRGERRATVSGAGSEVVGRAEFLVDSGDRFSNGDIASKISRYCNFWRDLRFVKTLLLSC